MSNDNAKLEPWLYPLIIEYSRKKVCTCSDRQFILDYQNRLVYCQNCGAIIDPFDALYDMALRADMVYRSVDTYSKLASEEFNRYLRYKNINAIAQQHKKGLFPICPKCQQMINPEEITSYASAKFYIKKPPKDGENL